MINLLNLKRPLVVFDLETTGVNVKKDRIVELAAWRLHPSGKEDKYTTLVNPEMPIPAPAAAVHKITDEEVAEAPTFAELSQELFDLFYNCDLGGYNCIKFDIPLLQNEFDRVGVSIDLGASYVIDAMRIFKHFEKHTLADAVKFYTGRPIADAHEAMADVKATVDVIAGQLFRYQLPLTVGEIAGALRPPGAIDEAGKLKMVNDVPTIVFGKHAGTPLKELDQGYIHWLIREKVIPDQIDLLKESLKKKKQ